MLHARQTHSDDPEHVGRGRGAPTAHLGGRIVARMAIIIVLLIGALASSGAGSVARTRAAMPLSMPGHLYFTRGASLYVSNPDGSGARQLTTYGTLANPDIMPAVSRDGTHLVYVQRNQPGHGNFYGIYELNADGSGRRNISGADQFPLNPTFSPDGSQVLYDTTVIYSYPSYATYAESSIRRLSDRAALNLFGSYYHPQSSPSWSPDGSTVVLQQLNDSKTGQTGLAAVYIGAMRGQPHGKQDHEIAALLTADTAHNYNTPIYSPDGRHIACIRTSLTSRVGDLYVMNNAGTGGYAVAPGASAYRPAWSPDGKEIAYTSGANVVIVAASGGRTLAMIPHAYGPAWGGRVTVTPVRQRMLAAPSPATPAPGGMGATPTPAVGQAPHSVTITKVELQVLINGHVYGDQSGIYDNQTGRVVVSYTATGGTPIGTIRLVGRIHKGRVFLNGPLHAGPNNTLTIDLKPTGGADDDVYDAYITVTVGSISTTAHREISITPAL